MKIGDEVFVHGYVAEIRNDTIIIRNVGGYFGTSRDEVFYYEEDGTMNEADRKTENSSEFPNNCEELNAYRECVKSRSFWDSKHCDGCYFDERCPFDEPKDEPQMGDAKPIPLSNRVTHIKDESQTDRAWK